MESIDKIRKAQSLLSIRLQKAPNFDIYLSAKKQLDYLECVLIGEEKDRANLKNIIVGHYGVREFEESDPELSDALTDVQAIVTKMVKGLKVD